MATLPEAATQAQPTDEFTPRSSFIEHVKYDRQSNTMDITFKSGSVHRYLFCFPATFETFRQSPDHSSFYAKAIKGKLMGIPVIKKTVGKNESHPLKAAHQKRSLDDGIPKRTAGTVARAFAGL